MAFQAIIFGIGRAGRSILTTAPVATAGATDTRRPPSGNCGGSLLASCPRARAGAPFEDDPSLPGLKEGRPSRRDVAFGPVDLLGQSVEAPNSFAEESAAVARGAVAGGADVTAGPVDGVAGGGESAGEGDGTAAVEVGGAAASWDGRMIRLSTKELTEDIAASARSRAVLTSATYPEIRRPTPRNHAGR